MRVVLIDNDTAEVMALGGLVDFTDSDSRNDAIRSHKNLGVTMLPDESEPVRLARQRLQDGIRDRKDFQVGIFTKDRRLIAIGAMGTCNECHRIADGLQNGLRAGVLSPDYSSGLQGRIRKLILEGGGK